MSRQSYTSFQKHLLFFSTPTNPPRLTFISALKGACALGLDFPVSVVLSLGLKLLYTPFSLKGIDINDIPLSSQRSQLSNVTLPTAKNEFTCSELLRLLDQERNPGFIKHKIDQGHLVGFWSMAADTRTHTVGRDDVERFQQGEWEAAVTERRRESDEILPLWRGGPIWAGGHSWAVDKLLGVSVYKPKKE
ncbi:hypothetical protein C7974DRAFT_398856 [Boeremia exigua]|uniref:uncharacterized protein n=1 Tax=Boeremia exigua TaxID=749465 RepID=UPI001E8E4465|nr:uncharacterized protein C7974DRAFT_398856 [Boeremia exigua]KAH6620081.1 hypothetical protein C7974DRAFT_398856 [Boeremia exigua]